jgi:hypothetical protein
MTISRTAAFRGISSCKIAAVTNDSPEAYTIGTLFDVPIRSLTITEEYETLELKQDDDVEAVSSILKSAEVTGIMAKVPLDVLEVLKDYFSLEIVSDKATAEGEKLAEARIKLKKCRAKNLEYTINSGFATITFAAEAIKTVYDGQIKEIIFNK